MSRFLSEKHFDLKPYTPGEQPKDNQYIKLNTNESPYPPSPKAVQYAREEADKCNLYPDPTCKELNEILSKELGVSREQVLVTNGSDEILNFAFMAFCDANTKAYFPDITYGFYKVFAMVNGVPYEEIPLNDDFSIDIKKYMGLGGTIFIANPNAPTGLSLGLSDIEKIVMSNPHNVVVVDEAYVDFGGESAVNLVNKYNNLLVTQTFSKSRSMAGSRIGFGVASKEIIADLNAIKYSTNPYNINKMSMAQAIGAILDREYFKANTASIIENREWTELELKKLGFSMTDSKANFIFAKHDKISGEQLYKSLKEQGILVRHFSSDRIDSYIRITVGTKEQMSEFIKCIKYILER